MLADLPTATVAGFEARTAFDAFIATEQAASAAETAQMLHAAGDPPFALFAEKRERPIRMDTALPISWVEPGIATSVTIEDTVQPSEYYAFQLGVFANEHDVVIEGWDVADASLKEAVSCFNLGGTMFNAGLICCHAVNGSAPSGLMVTKFSDESLVIYFS